MSSRSSVRVLVLVIVLTIFSLFHFGCSRARSDAEILARSQLELVCEYLRQIDVILEGGHSNAWQEFKELLEGYKEALEEAIEKLVSGDLSGQDRVDWIKGQAKLVEDLEKIDELLRRRGQPGSDALNDNEGDSGGALLSAVAGEPDMVQFIAYMIETHGKRYQHLISREEEKAMLKTLEGWIRLCKSPLAKPYCDFGSPVAPTVGVTSSPSTVGLYTSP